jgi:hypothetical protein
MATKRMLVANLEHLVRETQRLLVETVVVVAV